MRQASDAAICEEPLKNTMMVDEEHQSRVQRALLMFAAQRLNSCCLLNMACVLLNMVCVLLNMACVQQLSSVQSGVKPAARASR